MIRPIFLALLALAAMVVLAPADASAAQSAVTVSKVNLRAGPSTSYPAVAVMPAGSTITTYGCLADYSWCDVAWGGSRGWVAASYIKVIYHGQPVVLTPLVAPAVGLTVVAFNRAYWDRYYVGRPWYGSWNNYYRGGVSTSGAVACGQRGCAGARSVTGPRGNTAVRGGAVRRY